jgi:2-succinyl-6-hydroxy-2,4-cyclohexadiene-1-carboxylate synthase
MHRIAFLHGFTQTHHHWHRVALAVADRVGRSTLVLPDLPGHGLSANDECGMDETADTLARAIGPATYVGYSMGGRIALHTALLDGSPVERLVLIGATPGIADDGERAERRRLDDERADHIEQVGVDTFLDEWLAAPLFASLPPDPEGLIHRRHNTAAGLAHSLRTAGTGVQRSHWAELGRIAVPVLVITGELDTKFTEIGRRMAEALPDATFVSIEGAGHAAHTERPGQVAETIADWLS